MKMKLFTIVAVLALFAFSSTSANAAPQDGGNFLSFVHETPTGFVSTIVGAVDTAYDEICENTVGRLPLPDQVDWLIDLPSEILVGICDVLTGAVNWGGGGVTSVTTSVLSFGGNAVGSGVATVTGLFTGGEE